MSSQSFLEYYFKNKNKNGLVFFDDIKRNFDVKQECDFPSAPLIFEDANGLNFIKETGNKRITSAELLMSRLYKKLGFDSAVYYPCSKTSYYDCVVSKNLIDENSKIAKDFSHKIFVSSGNMFPKEFGVKDIP